MSENKFTPGPWVIAPVSVEGYRGFDINCGLPNNKKWVASIHAKVFSKTALLTDAGRERLRQEMIEVEANARLIAAAPDLLEALEAAIACGMVPVSSANDGGANKYSEQVRVADQIRAAIAKARGQS